MYAPPPPPNQNNKCTHARETRTIDANVYKILIFVRVLGQCRREFPGRSILPNDIHAQERCALILELRAGQKLARNIVEWIHILQRNASIKTAIHTTCRSEVLNEVATICDWCVREVVLLTRITAAAPATSFHPRRQRSRRPRRSPPALTP